MAYKCPQCGHTSEQGGDCPTCNVPMTETVEETQTEVQEMPSEEVSSPESSESQESEKPE